MLIWQIYHKEEQLDQIEYNPIANFYANPFFENSVIEEVLTIAQCNLTEEDKDRKYFGVLGYNYRTKFEEMKRFRAPFTNILETIPVIPEFAAESPDVIFLMETKKHDPILSAAEVHPNFDVYFNVIIEKLGYKWTPGEWDRMIYCNMFIAKFRVYERYVEEVLRPAMKIMEGMPELMQDSRYPKKVTGSLAKQLGMNHYPYHAFLCERLFGFWYNFIYRK